ncbi:MAG: UbiX family flavin prenyltransferase [Armatimonadetes bacterium]|jgi:4-hydroxy-3-polyprenylbenzoate decarboxylase|nr:UbiX family flavin prenyltransferase [Armatimonadota bacterium]
MAAGTPELLVAITGASGSAYGVRLVARTCALVEEVHLIVSRHGAQVLAHELGAPFDLARPSLRPFLGHDPENLRFLHPDDLMAACASGSRVPGAMVIIPASMGTVARLAAGLADDLVTRAAAVVLKERRRLILVPRETPLNLIQLRNLTTLAEAGATILPACPGFYHHPQTLDELIDFIVGRVLDHLGLPAPQPRWQPDAPGATDAA